MEGQLKPLKSDSTFGGYVTTAVQICGSDLQLGRALGFADGSRIGEWRRNEGGPSPLACVKIAQMLGDNPLHVLALGGHVELAERLQGKLRAEPPPLEAVRRHLMGLQQVIRGSIEMIETLRSDGGSEP